MADAERDDRTIARHLMVAGRVQGVFFRDSTRQQAQRRGVRGWVRNTADGSVETWLEGAPEDVDAVQRWIREGGPSAASVDQVDATEEEPAGHDGFSVRR